MKSFRDLKKNTEELNKKLAETLKDEGKGHRNVDPRLWYPSTDKAGNGSAVIRFLPAPQNEDQPYVRVWHHSFKGPGGWYIENSLSTIGKEDPVFPINQKLWESDIEENKKQASKQKRKTSYYTNILVIKDPQNPENEGQVKIFKFGPMIFDFIKAKLVPEFDDQTPVPIFDFWKGANFRIRIRTEGEYRKYDRSEFDSPSELFDGNDEKLEELWMKQYSLQEFVSPDKFKSYDDLKARLDKVLDLGSSSYRRSAVEDVEEDDNPFEAAKEPKKDKPAPVKIEEEDDDDLEFFAKLAAEED